MFNIHLKITFDILGSKLTGWSMDHQTKSKGVIRAEFFSAALSPSSPTLSL